METSLTVRRLTAAEESALQTLRQQASPAALDNFWHNVTEEKWATTVSRALSDNTEQWLLGAFSADRSQLFGTVGLRRELRPTLRHKASLWGLYVVPEKRCQGIGTQLVASLLEEARLMPGLEMIRLVVLADNKSTCQLLQKQGFQIYAVEPHAYRLDGDSYSDEAFLYRLLDEKGQDLS